MHGLYFGTPYQIVGAPNLGAIGQSLIPNADNTYDVGSAAASWKDGYFDGSLIVGDGTAADNALQRSAAAGTGINFASGHVNFAVGGGTEWFVSSANGNLEQSNGGRAIVFGPRGNIAFPGDGVISLKNNAGTSFDRLLFGGTSSSFPALKRNGAAFHARLADDSAFTEVQGSMFRSPVAAGGIGYATGAGGTVTQITSKATGVTLSTACGDITLNNAALAANTTVSFVLTNTAIAATDLLVLNHASGGTVGAYNFDAQCAAGSATINVRNVTAGSLSEAVVIRFAVIKGVTS